MGVNEENIGKEGYSKEYAIGVCRITQTENLILNKEGRLDLLYHNGSFQ
jgi:hypothetical protein